MECLDDYGIDACQGEVQYRAPLSGTGRAFARCDKHWSDRLDAEFALRQRYPEHAPSDWDPMYAGEHWDEDY